MTMNHSPAKTNTYCSTSTMVTPTQDGTRQNSEGQVNTLDIITRNRAHAGTQKKTGMKRANTIQRGYSLTGHRVTRSKTSKTTPKRTDASNATDKEMKNSKSGTEDMETKGLSNEETN